MEQKLSVFGLGKLGSAMLACLAYKGWEVIGVDINDDYVNKINNGNAPVPEPRVDGLIKENKERIQATNDVETAVFNSDVSFIIVPTPSQEDGLFSTKYVEIATQGIAESLRKKDSYHLIVITSTILIGDTERIASQIIKISGKEIGRDFGVVYNPEFIALGKIVHDLLNPDMILVGQSDDRAGKIVEDIHRKLVDNNPDIYRMNFYNAELAKISLNAYCTLKITFANTIAEICENIPRGDSEIVLEALGSDARIGHKYFRGGLGYAGPCFPRDCRALYSSAKNYGITNLFCNLTDEINGYHTERICKVLLKLLKEKNTNQLAILGLSYKEDTPIIEESISIKVAKYFSDQDFEVTLYDPAAMENAEEKLCGYDNIFFAQSEYSCIRNKSVCFIATPWHQFRKLTAKQIKTHMNTNPIILDVWRVLSFESDIDIRYVGKN